jgi:hypothetical protein
VVDGNDSNMALFFKYDVFKFHSQLLTRINR